MVDADKIGKEAITAGLRTPKDIFWKLYPGKKLDKREDLPAHRKKLEDEREKAEAAKAK